MHNAVIAPKISELVQRGKPFLTGSDKNGIILRKKTEIKIADLFPVFHTFRKVLSV